MDCLRNSKLLRVQKCSGIRFEACGILLSMDTEALTFLWFGERFKKIFRRSNNFACSDLKTARDQMEMGLPDLILLDINLPDGSGLDFLKKCKQTAPWIPVILLTANDTDLDIVEGLDLGADDYVTKPFSPAELTARVDALYRRLGDDDQESDTGEIIQGPFKLNTRNRTLEKNGQRIRLTQVEYSIMKMFMDNPGKALSREDILNTVWGRDYFGELKIVDVNIRRLRIKIEDDSTNPTYITTVWGFGYKWGM